MSGVFVYDQEAVLQFDNDIGFQGLAQDLVVGNREVINILNSFFDRVRLDGRYRGDGTGDLIGVRRTFKKRLLLRQCFLSSAAGVILPVGERSCVGFDRHSRSRNLSVDGFFRRRPDGCRNGHGRLHPRRIFTLDTTVKGRSCRNYCRRLGGDAVFAQKRILDRLEQQIENTPLFREFDFGFCGVDIHVHGTGGNFQPDDAGRVPPGEKAVFVGLLQRRLQQCRANEPAVAEEKLRAAVAAPGCRGRDKTGQAEPVLPTDDRQQGLREFPPQQGVNAGVGLSVAGGEKLLFAVPQKAD